MEISVFFLLLICCCCNRLVFGAEWIVSPAIGVYNCANCHNLSYYLRDPSLYLTSDTVLTFLEGTHLLDELVIVSGVTNLTLQGEGEIQDGYHWTVRESTVKIQCTMNSNSGLFFVNWTGINIESITFERCGAQVSNQLLSDITTHYSSLPYNWDLGIGNPAFHSLLFVNGSDLTLQSVTVQNGSGYGLTIVNSYDIDINKSYFFANNYDGCEQCFFGGNIRIVHLPISSSSECPYVSQEDSLIAITDTYVSYGANFGRVTDSNLFGILPNYVGFLLPLGGGIVLVPADYSCNRFRYELDNVVVYQNSARTGANFAMFVLPVPITISRMHNSFGFSSGFYPPRAGSGLLFVAVTSLPSGVQSRLTIVDSNISDNLARDGSGLYLVTYGQRSWDSVIIQSCNFTHNEGFEGAGVYIERRDVVDLGYLFVSLVNVSVINSVRFLGTIDSSSLFKAAVTLINVQCNISGLEIADSFELRGLGLSSSRVHVYGNNTIRNNTAVSNSGGGVLLNNDAYFIFHPPSSLLFINNHADVYGGGIYILPRLNASSSPPCFFQINDPSHSVHPDVLLYSENNTADVTGSFIGGGELTYCSFTTTNFHHSYCSNTIGPPLCSFYLMMEYIYPLPATQDNFFISSSAVGVSLCQGTADININSREHDIYTQPGKQFEVKLIVFSETTGIAPGTIIGKVYNDLQSNGPVISSLTRDVGTRCSDIQFVGYQFSRNIFVISIQLSTPQMVNYLYSSIYPLQISVHFEPCPPWFELTPLGISSFLTCGCNSYITSVNPDTICNINTTIITSSPQVGWIGYSTNCTYVGKGCPNDYCVTEEVNITINNTDPQCALNRSGVVCGDCAEGLSLMLGSNKCGDCSDSTVALLLVFGVAGFALVILLIGLNLTVTVGTINGLIFYANIVKINQPIFFPHGPISVLSQFISWINLDFGIETCFYKGMTPSDKVWLQFVFPLYIWIIIGVVIITVKGMTRYRIFEPVTRYFIHLKLINVFATLLLLSYTKLIQTLVIIFTRFTLQCDGVTQYRWYFDGTIEYASSAHLPLFLFGIVFLVVFVIPYTLFLFGLPLLEKLPTEKVQFCSKIWLNIKPLADAYASPYKDRYRFWVGFLIFIRLVIATVFSLGIDFEFILHVVLFIVLFTLMFSVVLEGPYTNRYLNILEHWFLINLLGLIGIALPGNRSQTWYIISYSVAFFTFLCVIVWHIYTRLAGHFGPRKTFESLRKKHLQRKKKKKNPFLDGANDLESSFITPGSVNSRSAASTQVSTSEVGVSILKFAPSGGRVKCYRDSALGLIDDD